MEYKFGKLFILIVMLISALAITNAVSTTNGKLLKFFPITSEQYRTILSLSKQQPVVSEEDIAESHRSLADWSNTLQNRWNALFNVTNRTSLQNDEKTYPICVIKTNDRQQRGARQYQQYNVNYAGLAPNVAYTGSPYYVYPQYGPQYQQLPYVEEDDDENNDEDYDTENDDDENSDNEEESNGENSTSVPNKDSNTPVINCVVVVRRTNHVTLKPTNSNTENTLEGSPIPYYPYPYAFPQTPLVSSLPFTPQIPPYPINTYPYVSSRSNIQSLSENNKFSSINPDDALRYQELISEYYKYLQSLYMEDASVGSGKNSLRPEHEHANNEKGDPNKSI